jgi:hypothetical protein
MKFNSIEEIAEYLEAKYKEDFGEDVTVDREYLTYFYLEHYLRKGDENYEQTVNETES